MPGKSGRKRGKYSQPAPKKKSRPIRPAVTAEQATVAQEQQPVDHPRVPVPKVEVPVATTKPIAVEHPFVATELRTIGVLAAIMLTVLVLLSIFMP